MMNDVIYNACFDELKQIQKKAGILGTIARGLGGATLGAGLGYGVARLSGAKNPWRYALLGGLLGGAGGTFYPQLKSYGLRGIRRLKSINARSVPSLGVSRVMSQTSSYLNAFPGGLA